MAERPSKRNAKKQASKPPATPANSGKEFVTIRAQNGALVATLNNPERLPRLTQQWNYILRGDFPIVTEEFPMVSFMDVLGKWSSDDVETWLKYYADEKARQSASEFRTGPLPDHEDPPYQRDHLLPKASGDGG